MENCDITIDELCVLLAAEGIEAKRSTLGDFLLAQGLSRKKRQPTPPSRSALTSRRREPLGATSNLGWIAERLVFLDETWARRTWPGVMAGHRAANGWWRPFPMATGRQPRSLPPCVTTGSPRPARWPDQRRKLPCLGPASPGPDPVRGRHVIMDNLSSHGASVHEAIDAHTSTPLYLPPYSPDLNPMRTGLRQAQSHSPQSARIRFLAGNWKP